MRGYITSHTLLYGIIGYPVKHTLSPVIHNECFKKRKIDAVYLAFEVRPSDLKEAINGIKALGIRGLSVTIPHKKLCMKYLDEIDRIALGIGAVNTIINVGGKLYGYNTDYLGVMKSFEKRKVNVVNKRVLVIGSGGASRAVCFALAEMNIRELYITGIVNKEVKSLIRDIRERYSYIKVEGFTRDQNIEKEVSRTVDIIVNASPIGMHPNVKRLPLNPAFIDKRHVLFDVVYTPEWTYFLKVGREKGCRVISGVDMFVYQAIEQFKLFTDKSINEKLIREILKRKG